MEIRWRYCLDELPAYGEVILRTILRNEDVKDRYDTYPYFGLESYIGHISLQKFRDANSFLRENHDANMEFWWIPAKEFPWPEKILNLHSFDPPAYVMKYKPEI